MNSSISILTPHGRWESLLAAITFFFLSSIKAVEIPNDMLLCIFIFVYHFGPGGGTGVFFFKFWATEGFSFGPKSTQVVCNLSKKCTLLDQLTLRILLIVWRVILY